MASYFWVGGTGTWDNSSTANWSASSGGAAGAGPPTSSDSVTFDSSSGTGTCTTGTGATCAALTFNTSTVGLTLGANLTATGTATLTLGAWSFASFTFICQLFSSVNTNTRSIAFGTGKMQVTGNAATVWGMNDPTGSTFTGTRTVEFTYSGSTGTRIFNHGTSGPGASEANSADFYITAGSDICNLSNCRTLDTTGFSGSLSNTRAHEIYGSVVFSATTTVTAGTNGMSLMSGTSRTITTNGITLDIPLTFDGTGGTWALQDNLTQGSTRTTTHTRGTLDLNGKTLTVGTLAGSNANTRTLAFGTGGSILVKGSGASAFTYATSTNLTITGTGTVSLDSSAAKTFAGGSKTWPITLTQAGTGALTISGTNTFTSLANSVTGTTITLTAGTTTTVSTLSLNGVPNSLVTLNSSSGGSAATISKASGGVTVSYLSIQDSTATGGASFTALNSTNVSGNTGWLFTNSNSVAASISYGGIRNFLSLGRI